MRVISALMRRSRSLLLKPGQSLMVVGMHRSGTSFLTGSLQQAGLELGQHSAWNPHNLKGNRENQAIVAFHDALLSRHGYAWDNPPDSALAWSPREVSQARGLINQYRGVKHWGFKDPRALLLVEGWQKLLPDMRFVGIFRHPAAVARSLQARGGMPQEKAFSLWLAYNRCLLALHRRQPFPLLCFDQDEAVLHDKLDEILLEIGLSQLRDERFFSAELKHHQVEAAELPGELQMVYEELSRVAL